MQAFILSTLLLSLPLASSLGLSAEALSIEELKSLQQKMKSATQLSVDFDQTKTTTLRPQKPSRSSGHAVFAKPAKFRWELQKGETLIYDGTTLHKLDTKEKIATKYEAGAERSVEINEIIGLVLEFDSLQKKYKVSESTKDGMNVLLKLKPNAANGIDTIEVRIDSASASIKGLKLTFSNQNTSDFAFSNPDRSAISARTFEVPKEYKVVKGI